jgi:hypothetical protein
MRYLRLRQFAVFGPIAALMLATLVPASPVLAASPLIRRQIECIGYNTSLNGNTARAEITIQNLAAGASSITLVWRSQSGTALSSETFPLAGFAGAQRSTGSIGGASVVRASVSSTSPYVSATGRNRLDSQHSTRVTCS